MASPVFVNAGTRTASLSNTSRAPALPASLVTGNLLLAAGGSEVDEDAAFSGGGTWSEITAAETRRTAMSLAVARRYVDGGESAPTIAWTTAAACWGLQLQYSGVDPSSPIGAISTNSGSGSTVTCPAIDSTRADSRFVYIISHAAVGSFATPSGWTEDFDGGASGTHTAVGGKDVSTIGTSSGAISVSAGGVGPWCIAIIEILSPAAVTAVGRDASMTWDVRSAVGRAGAQTWAARSAIGRSAPATWAVRGTVGAAASSTWDVRFAIGRTATATWDVRSLVGLSTTSAWGVRGVIGRGALSGWALRELAGRAGEFTWVSRGAVARIAMMRWAVFDDSVVIVPTRHVLVDCVIVQSAVLDTEIQSAVQLEGIL